MADNLKAKMKNKAMVNDNRLFAERMIRLAQVVMTGMIAGYAGMKEKPGFVLACAVLLIGLLVPVSASAQTAKCYPTTSCQVAVTPGNFLNAVRDQPCGCTLTLASGNYPSFTYTKNCTADNPFILEAQTQTGPRFGKINVNGNGLIMNGFTVTDQITVDGDYNRVTRSLFTGEGQLDYEEGSQFNRVDHNDFIVPQRQTGEEGTTIAFYRPRSTEQMYNNNRIDSNYFTTNTPNPTSAYTGFAIFLCMYGAQNGYPFLSKYGSARTLIENNLFENWGRKNVMEVKCSDNVFRNNTLVNTGRVLNRHGYSNTYTGNWFENMTTGLAVREYNTQITNNRFTKADIILYKGTRKYPDGACYQARYWMPADSPGAPQGPPSVKSFLDNNIATNLLIGDKEGDNCEVPVYDTTIKCHQGPIRHISEVRTSGPTSTTCSPTAQKLTRDQVGRGGPEGSCEVPIVPGPGPGPEPCTGPIDLITGCPACCTTPLPPPGPCGKNSELPWASGFSPGTGIGAIALRNAEGFGNWRGRPVDVGTVFIGKNSWQTSYAAYLTNEVLRPTGAVRAFSQAGICPVLTVPLVTLADFMKFDMVAGGGIDAEHTAIAKKIHEAIGEGVIYLRLGHEADEGYPWSYTNPGRTADPATYKAAWGRIAKIYKAEMPNARIVWNVLKNTRLKIRDYYPGSDVVDVLSIDPYDNGAGGFCDSATSPGWVNMCYGGYNAATGESKGVKGLLDFARTVGKRIAIDEWGASNKPLSAADGANNSYYAGAMYDFFNANKDYIEYESYYNRAGGGKHQIWPRVEYNGKVSDAYLAKYKGTVPVPPITPLPACPGGGGGGGGGFIPSEGCDPEVPASALTPPVEPGGQVDIAVPANSVIDLRGKTLNVTPVARSGVVIRGGANARVTGARIIGPAPRSTFWDHMKKDPVVNNGYDGDGVLFKGGGGVAQVDHVWIDNMMDAISVPDVGSFKICTVYARYTRDDFIENDRCHDGTISDVLVDDTHMFISMRRGHSAASNECTANITIEDSLVRLGCQPYRGDMKGNKDPNSCNGRTTGSGQLFKTGAGGPTVNIKNTVFLVESRNEGGIPQMNFPRGTYENVTLVWLGGGAYPGALPATGVTVTNDINVWNTAKAAWLSAHGCDANGDSCAFTNP